MNLYVDTNRNRSPCINLTAIRQHERNLPVGLIAPAAEEIRDEAVPEHTSEPIKDVNDIIEVSRFLIREGRYRDNMLFIVGINFGLRVSDLLSLRFSHVIREDGCGFRDSFAILEKKTRNTRKRKQNRYITINSAVMEAVELYLEHTPGVVLSDYMFRSESNRGINDNRPMHRNSVDRILKDIAAELGLKNKMSTHTLRKTFAYHQMLMAGNDPRRLLLLQKMFGHSSMAQTLDYIGITNDEIEEAYQNLNLGSEQTGYSPESLVNSVIMEVG